MSEKKSIEVLIGGKVFHISGTESEEHMKKVAEFLNNRLRQAKEMTGSNLTNETLISLTALNISDDLMKLVELVHSQEEQIRTLKNEKAALEQSLSEYEDDLMKLESEALALREQLKQESENAQNA